MRTRAFTLIELLVVVAIIALLMAILLPSLGNAREQGRVAVCLSNLHNLAVAVQMYADTNQGRLPGAGLAHGGSGNDEKKSWVTQLADSYARQSAIVRCPSDRSRHWTLPLPDGRVRLTSFASNSYLAYPIGGKPAYDRIERIRFPATTIFWAELVEEGAYAGADHVHAENWWFGNSRTLAAEQLQIDRHQKQIAYAFIDGHAARLPFELTYQADPAGGFPPKFLNHKYDPAIAR